MKTMKSILCLLLCLLLGLSCAACGESPAPARTEAPTQSETPDAAPTEVEPTAEEPTAEEPAGEEAGGPEDQPAADSADEGELPLDEETKPLEKEAENEGEGAREEDKTDEDALPREEDGTDEDELPLFPEAGMEAQAPATLHHVEISIRDYGTVTVELDAEAAPITVQNFLELAGSGFYDGLTFHRIIDGFMVQGGDPLGNGTGGTDKKIPGEFALNGWDNPISHKKGVISMARARDVNSASCQFFICVADSEYLDGQYAAFGHVTEGMEILERIAGDARPIDNNGTIPADRQPVIERMTVLD